MLDGRPAYYYNLFGAQQFKTHGETALDAGEHQVRIEFDYDGGGYGKGGDVTLFLDGTQVGTVRVDATVPMIFSLDETTDIGRDTATSVTDDLSVNETLFNGQIRWIQIDVGEDAEDADNYITPEERFASPWPSNRRPQRAPSVSCKRGIHFGTAVGRRAFRETVSVLDSHRTDDSGPKVGRWPTSVGATVPKRIPHSCNMGGLPPTQPRPLRALRDRNGDRNEPTHLQPRTNQQDQEPERPRSHDATPPVIAAPPQECGRKHGRNVAEAVRQSNRRILVTHEIRS